MAFKRCILSVSGLKWFNWPLFTRWMTHIWRDIKTARVDILLWRLNDKEGSIAITTVRDQNGSYKKSPPRLPWNDITIF